MLGAAVSLNFMYFADMAINNLFWVFGFLVAGYMFSKGKTPVSTGLLWACIIFFTTDIFHMVGFGIYTTYGLLMLYIARMTIFMVLENKKNWAPKIPLFYTLAFFVVFAFAATGFV